MLRVKRQKEKVCHCYNCSYDVPISPKTVKEKLMEDTLGGALIATYIECPVCGEKLLKQLDTHKSKELSEKGVKLELMQKKGNKLSPQQKVRLQSIEKVLYNTRKQLKEKYWDEIYQSLNQYEEDQTGIADQELTPGIEVTSTENAGERNQYEDELLG